MTLRPQFTLAVLAALLAMTNPVSSAHAADEMPSGVLISSRAIAFNPSNGKIYVVDEGRGAVSIIDSRGESSGSVSVKVGSGPDAIAVNSVTGRVYVANSSDGTVSAIDGATNTVTGTFKAGAHPYTLAVNEAANKVYVTNTFSDAVAEIDPSTNLTRFLKIGSADNVAVNARTNQVFLLGYEDANIRIMNGATDLVEKVLAHEHLWAMAINEATGKLYVSGVGSSEILAIDAAAGHRQTKIPVGAIPCAVAVNAQSNMIYVVNYGDSTVTVIDGKKESTVATIKVGKGPQAIAMDSRVNRLYVANTHDNSVTIIDGQRNAAVATVAAGRNPFAISVGSKPGTIYVANFGEPSFSAVNVETK